EFPDRPIRRLRLAPKNERAAIYGLTATRLAEHPLHQGVRQKARLALPPGATFNAIGELDGLALDLGQVISATRALDYDAAAWNSRAAEVQPAASDSQAIVEYTAHPGARLHETHTGGAAAHDLDALREAGR